MFKIIYIYSVYTYSIYIHMYRHTFPYIELTLKHVLVMVDITIHNK